MELRESCELENAVGRGSFREEQSMLSLKCLLYIQVKILSKLSPCMNLDFGNAIWAGDVNLVVIWYTDDVYLVYG